MSTKSWLGSLFGDDVRSYWREILINFCWRSGLIRPLFLPGFLSSPFFRGESLEPRKAAAIAVQSFARRAFEQINSWNASGNNLRLANDFSVSHNELVIHRSSVLETSFLRSSSFVSLLFFGLSLFSLVSWPIEENKEFRGAKSIIIHHYGINRKKRLTFSMFGIPFPGSQEGAQQLQSAYAC